MQLLQPIVTATCQALQTDTSTSDNSRSKLVGGLIEVYCTDVDWGHLANSHDQALQLEHRLCKLGTQHMLTAASASHGPITESEGVTISLGPYDAKLRAFVQCSLKISLVEATKWKQYYDEIGQTKDGMTLDYSSSDEDAIIMNGSGVTTNTSSSKVSPVKRRSFKWWRSL